MAVAGGYLKSQGPTLPAVLIELGAHHLDLRSADPEDPECVKVARQQDSAWV